MLRILTERLRLAAGLTLGLWLLATAALVAINAAPGGYESRRAAGNAAGVAWVVATAAIVALAAVGPVLKARATAVPAALAARGWVTQPDPNVAQRLLHDFTFDELHGMSENLETRPDLATGGRAPSPALAGPRVRWRGVSEVMTNVSHARPLVSFRNDYVFVSGHIPGSKLPAEPEFTGVKTVMRNAGVVAAQASAVLPYLHLAPHVALLGRGLDVDWPGFGDRWHVDPERHDHAYARAVLSRAVVSLLMDERARPAGHIILHRGYVLSIVDITQHTPATIDARVDLVRSVAAALPASYATTYAYAAVDPSVPGWRQPRR